MQRVLPAVQLLRVSTRHKQRVLARMSRNLLDAQCFHSYDVNIKSLPTMVILRITIITRGLMMVMGMSFIAGISIDSSIHLLPLLLILIGFISVLDILETGY